MSPRRFASLAFALVLAAGCAEGATGAGTPGAGGSGDGGSGSPAGNGGAGQGGNGTAGGDGDGDGDGGSGTPSSTSGGGDGGGSSSSTTTDASSSAMSSTSSGQADPGTIYFSEYMEGSGNNKALEVYNAGSTPIDLGNCHLEFYQNGSTTAQTDVPFEDEMLAAGDVYVICQSNFGEGGRCDRQAAAIQHSGDDAIALVCDGSRKDVFGKIGEDPGSAWGTGLTSSAESTLRRKCSVLEGDTNGGDAFDPATQWEGVGNEDFSDLGQYDCP